MSNAGSEVTNLALTNRDDAFALIKPICHLRKRLIRVSSRLFIHSVSDCLLKVCRLPLCSLSTFSAHELYSYQYTVEFSIVHSETLP